MGASSDLRMRAISWSPRILPANVVIVALGWQPLAVKTAVRSMRREQTADKPLPVLPLQAGPGVQRVQAGATILEGLLRRQPL